MCIAKRIRRDSQSCMQFGCCKYIIIYCRIHCMITTKDYIGYCLLKYCVKESFFRLLSLSSVIVKGGESSYKQSSKKSVHTVYGYNNVNFLNQLNLLLLEQYFGSFYELALSLCNLKQPEATE